MKRKIKLNILIFLMITALLLPTACGSVGAPDTAKTVIRLAAPQNAYIEDFETNLYKLSLEEQTGLTIEMTWLPANEAESLARLALATGQDLPDAYIGFGSTSYEIFQNPNLQRYGEQGVIIPLNDLIERYGVYTKMLYAELPEFNIEALMTSADGNIYAMPGFSSSVITRYRQLMWVNQGWLDALELPPPDTTEAFREMLRAFKAHYPGNIPMSGTEAHYGKQAHDHLFNAFIYNDTNNSRLLLEDGVIGFAPVRDEWRDALRFMKELYDEGLYSPLSFTQDNQQMNQMANDMRDVLGAFVSPGITLTVYQNAPEMMERYAGIGPLMGPDGVQLSTVFSPLPRPSGVITSASAHPEEVFKLFDLMLSEEACLMGRYGERGVDWDFAEAGEISIYGTPATIRIIQQLWNTPQNKHLAQIGPYVSRPRFSGGVTWDGNTTDGEYMNAQAALLYQDYEPTEYIRTLIYTPEEETLVREIKVAVEARVRETVVDFITGKRNIHSDTAWALYISEFDALGLPTLLSIAQTAQDRQEPKNT